jgi:hypothetical protein
MMNRSAGLACIAVLVLPGCGGGADRVSDTGYEGTWQRGNERVTSTLAIVRHEGEYLVRWTKTSADGTVKLNCDWQGQCAEFVEGEKTSEYAFRAWVDEERGNLRLECKGRVHEPLPLDVHFIDELVVRKKGLLLRSHTLMDENGTYEFKKGPKRELRKVSDDVLDPPQGWRPRGA